MTVHLLKLAVGCESVDQLRVRTTARAPGACAGSVRITTRMAPRRVAELLDGGSLYWVVKGALAARQEIRGIEPEDGGPGARTAILLDARVVNVRPRPCRPFQGWRYLRVEDAPADLSPVAIDEAMPSAMRRDLMELCLI